MSMIDEAKEVFDIEIAELAKVRDRIDESIKNGNLSRNTQSSQKRRNPTNSWRKI